LEHREQIQSSRRRIWHYYREHLEKWACRNSVRLPVVPEHCEQPWHMFYMLMPSLEARQGLIAHLKECEILSVFHYLPLHLSEMGRRWGGKEGDCPVTEHVSDCVLRLPFYNELNEADQARVVSAINEFACV
jgi:dTDP-4-amino-4,6-dideoxygalactose transaminase